MDERELLIYGPIGAGIEGMVDDREVTAELDRMKKARRITVRLNSPGGDFFAGLAIHHALRRHSATIHIVVDALAASAASVIAMAGSKITMSAGALLMVHRSWAIAGGNAEELEATAAVLRKVDSSLVDIYAERSGLSKARVKAMVDAETWLTPSEAVELGLADEASRLPTAAQARVPEGWFARAPANLARYPLTERRHAASVVGDKDLLERKDRLRRLKQELGLA